MRERPEEAMARHVVALTLGVPVDRFEDGSRDKMVDAVIRFPHGRLGWLEVVSDHDTGWVEQRNAMKRRGEVVKVPALRHRWITSLDHRANVRRLHEQLPAVLLDHQERGLLDIGQCDSDELAELGVLGITRIGGQPDGDVFLNGEGWTGWAGPPDALARWIEKILVREADVPAKLASCPPSDERHAFLWALSGATVGVQLALEFDGRAPGPGPHLPAGVDRVWVAGGWVGQGAVTWSPTEGWERTPWQPDARPD